jgi:hypothetical protein
LSEELKDIEKELKEEEFEINKEYDDPEEF